MSIATPSFDASCITAYNQMTTLESPNDYFVAGFRPNDKSQLVVRAQGRGGVHAVTKILSEEFSSEIGVAMFRVTALDERGLTTSKRTKLVHVIFVGSETPVMVRAKVSSWNSALKHPFSFNLAIQTNNAVDDLSEKTLERALRASGGAHQPTSFDFSNTSTAQDPLPPRSEPTPAQPPPIKTTTFVPIDTSLPSAPSLLALTPSRRTPGGNEKFQSVVERYQRAFSGGDVAAIVALYDEINCTLVHTSVAVETTTEYKGRELIADFFSQRLGRLCTGHRQLTLIKVQPDPDQSSEGMAYLHWTADAVTFASETILIVAGAIIAHTLVTDLEAESERGDVVAPLRGEWPGGSTTASYGDQQSFGDGTTTLDDPSTGDEHRAGQSEEEEEEQEEEEETEELETAAQASTRAQPSDTDSQAPTLISEEEPNLFAKKMTGGSLDDTDSQAPTLVSEDNFPPAGPKKHVGGGGGGGGSLEEEEFNFGGDDDSVNPTRGTSLKSEETED